MRNSWGFGRSGGSGGGGKGDSIRGARPSGAPAKDSAPRPSTSFGNKREQERVLKGSDGLSAQSGEKAVETSIATEELKRAQSQTESESIGTRFVDGQLFVYKSGNWQQDGVSSSGGAVKIKVMSDAYFTLLKARPDLRKRLSLGPSVTLKIGRKTVIIGADGLSTLDAKAIAGW
jgi:hypothetical protein